ncbi:hypothetical protein [Accumulibacter sp.]|uniref:hypothetical protein n=1 Tax=Accumulibacter sp. TaxID=2053492 RepID=UPI0028789746|nr:hypothetical protein [Accumulibacter sp.]MDS4056361.1 hypothetical protein [Accumulibacter sp.]HMW81880.1 hypothetical protein [Accumulibacter sp.]
MSNVLNSLLSRGGLFKTVFAGAVFAASLTAHAAVDAPAAPSHVGDSAAQVQPFDALVGFDAAPLSVAEADSFDGERIRLRVSFAGIHIGTIHAGSRYRGPHFKGSLKCVPVPTPAGGVTVKCGLSW